jgi:hypothetical protein
MHIISSSNRSLSFSQVELASSGLYFAPPTADPKDLVATRKFDHQSGAINRALY